MYSIFFVDMNDQKYDEALLDRYRSYLSFDEFKRYFRFQDLQRQRKFLIAHGELRTRIALTLNTHPEFVSLMYSETGKLFEKSGAINFSISHTDDIIYFAIADKNIGIDCEKMIDRDFDKIARFIFSNEIANDIVNENDWEQKRLKFYNKWTEKEALVKYYDSSLFKQSLEHDLQVYRLTTPDNINVAAVMK